MAEFGTLSLEDLQGEGDRLSQEPGEGGGFLDQFVPMPEVKPGQTAAVVIRILPPAKGQKLFQYTRLHLINNRKYHCPKPLVAGKWDRNTPCPICDYYNALWRQSDKLEEQGRKEEAEKLRKEARSIKPIERYYYNALVRKLVTEKGEEHNVGPRILSVGKVLHKMIVRGIMGDETEPGLGDVTNPKTGYDFVIKKELRGTGENAFPNYDRSSFAREITPTGTAEEMSRWCETLHDLTKLRVLKPFADLEKELAIHRGLIADEAETFDIDSFDARYRGNGNGKSTATSVSMATTKTTPPATTVESVVAPVVKEDVSIEDADFLKEMQDMMNA